MPNKEGASRLSYEQFRAIYPPIAGGAPTATETAADALAALRKRHDTLLAEVRPLIDERRTARREFEARITVEDESKRPTDEERAEFAAADERFNEQVAGKLDELRALQTQIEQGEAM